jgi:phasin family protein
MATKNSNTYNTDLFKAWSSFKAPSFDMNQLFTMQRRNVEAFTAANQMMMESAQAITKRQTEMIRDTVEQFLKTTKDIMTSSSPETNTARQTEYAKSMYENAISSAREISEMATKSSMEAFDMLNRRAAESVEEISSFAKAA